jgi:hypothetical protein
VDVNHGTIAIIGGTSPIYKAYNYKAYFSGNIPTKHGLKNGTVPPF